jgi:predicted dehydrogenase
MSFRVALIGNRAHQNTYGPLWAGRSDTEVVALAEHNEEKALALEAQYGLPCSREYDAVLERDDVDIVCIATDFYLKRRLLPKALACGKHVMVDKSLARTMQEAREIERETQATELKVHLSYPHRFYPGYRALLQRLQSGEYTQPVSWTNHFIRQFPDVDLAQYVSYPTAANVNGGGELMNLGSHPVDLIHHAFGMPRRVYAHFETAYWNDYYDQFGTEDAVTMVCEYEHLMATVVVGRNRVSEEGNAIDSIDLWCKGVHARATVQALHENERMVDIEMPELTGAAACVQNLIDAIVDDAPLESTIADGVAATAITTAGYQSAANRSFIDLPLLDDRHPMISDNAQTIDGYLD